MTGGDDFSRMSDLLSGVGPKVGEGAPSGRPQRPSAEVRPVEPGDIARRVAVVWVEAVGPEIAANARPAQLRQGRLVVSTSSSAWAQSLQLMGEKVRDRLNETLSADGSGSGGEAEHIRTIFFRHAGWEVAPVASSDPSPRRSSDPASPGRRAGRSAQGSVTGGPLDADVATDDANAVPRPVSDPVRGSSTAGNGVLTVEQQSALDGVRDLPVSRELREVIARAMEAAFARDEG